MLLQYFPDARELISMTAEQEAQNTTSVVCEQEQHLKQMPYWSVTNAEMFDIFQSCLNACRISSFVL